MLIFKIRCDFTKVGHANSNRAATWIGYCRLLLDIIGYFSSSFKTHELPGGKNVWK